MVDIEFVGFCSVVAIFRAYFGNFVIECREKELSDLIATQRLGLGARDFAYGCLNEGYVPDEGTGLAAILPPVRRFGEGGDREKLRAHVRELLQEWVDRFSGLGGL